MTEMNLIAAVDEKNGIGRDNMLLFHIPEDMKRFRSLTMGAAVVMGGKTMRSLPNQKPLEGRENIVLTRDKDFSADGFTVCNSVDDLFEILKTSDKPIFVIGGGEIYSLLLPYCSRAYITHIDADGHADTFFPDFGTKWRLASQSETREYNGIKYRFCEYERTAR